MNAFGRTKNSRRLWLASMLLGLLATSGCHLVATHSVPAQQVPPDWRGECRNGLVPIDLTLLSQPPPPQHIVGPRDVLGIYIQNVYAENDQQTPPFTYPNVAIEGHLAQPAVGNPVVVQVDGTIALPLIPPLRVSGLSIPEVAQLLRRAYTQDQQILQPGRDRISVTLIRPRISRITVVRGDATSDLPVAVQRDSIVNFRRGSGKLVELPAYENDVLHALVATGGLPGIDAYDVVWVLRNQAPDISPAGAVAGSPMANADLATRTQFTKIPLHLHPGELAPFGPQDVVLNTGDIVYIEPRTTEFFFVGGLLEGGQFPLPRDYDLDVLGAIAMANGSVTGPASQTSSGSLYRGGVGNVVPPSRAVVVRTLPTGGLVKIDVDLRVALENPRERLVIQPGDLILLKYRWNEAFANTALNIINWNFTYLISR